MPKTRAQENRAIRQEALREQLSKQKHLEQVVEITKKLDEPTNGETTLDDMDLKRLRLKADIHLSLIKKYIPDLKQSEQHNTYEEPVDASEEPLNRDEWSKEFGLESTDGTATRSH